MLFVVQFEDVYADQPERLPEREQHMSAHPAFLAQHPDKVVAAGAFRESQEGTPLGGIWIVNASDQAAVEALYQSDPFWTAGLRRSVRVPHGRLKRAAREFANGVRCSLIPSCWGAPQDT